MTVDREISEAERQDEEERFGRGGYFRDHDGALWRYCDRVETMQPGDLYPELAISSGRSYHDWLHVLEVNGQLSGMMPMTAEDLGIAPEFCPSCGHPIRPPYFWTERYKGQTYHNGCAPRILVDCPDCSGSGEIVRRKEVRSWFRTRPAVREPCDCARVCKTPGKWRVLAP